MKWSKDWWLHLSQSSTSIYFQPFKCFINVLEPIDCRLSFLMSWIIDYWLPISIHPSVFLSITCSLARWCCNMWVSLSVNKPAHAFYFDWWLAWHSDGVIWSIPKLLSNQCSSHLLTLTTETQNVIESKWGTTGSLSLFLGLNGGDRAKRCCETVSS